MALHVYRGPSCQTHCSGMPLQTVAEIIDAGIAMASNFLLNQGAFPCSIVGHFIERYGQAQAAALKAGWSGNHARPAIAIPVWGSDWHTFVIFAGGGEGAFVVTPAPFEHDHFLPVGSVKDDSTEA